MDTIKKPRAISLEGNLSENWHRFHQVWQVYYSLKTHGQIVDGRYKTSLFLHVVGEDAVEVYHSLPGRMTVMYGVWRRSYNNS